MKFSKSVATTMLVVLLPTMGVASGIPKNVTIDAVVEGVWSEKKTDTFKNGLKKRHKTNRNSEKLKMRIFRVKKRIFVSQPDNQKGTIWSEGSSESFEKGGLVAGMGKFVCESFTGEEGVKSKDCSKYSQTANGFTIDVKNSGTFGTFTKSYSFKIASGKCSTKRAKGSGNFTETEENGYGYWPEKLRRSDTKSSYRFKRGSCKVLRGRKPF